MGYYLGILALGVGLLDVVAYRLAEVKVQSRFTLSLSFGFMDGG